MAKLIKRDELESKLNSGEDFHLIEVLSENEYNRLHIKGAVHIQFNRIGALASKRFGRQDQLVLYCMDTECKASAIAAEKLENMGFTNVLIYKGGKTEWVAAGLPVEGADAA